jgi:hypothetical protein
MYVDGVAVEMTYFITPFEFRSQYVLLLHSATCGHVAVVNIPRLSTQFLAAQSGPDLHVLNVEAG